MKLASFLEKSHIGRREFAVALGVSDVTVTRYINGSRIPRPRHMKRIKELSGGVVTADDFLAIGDAATQGEAE